jgi:hypothetical protein
MWGIVIKLLTGGLLDSILGLLKQRSSDTAAMHNVDTQAATQIATAEIQAEIESRKAQRDVILAERGSWPAAMIRPAFAAPFVIYVWKVVVYDKVLGLGTTDAITGAVGDWAGWIITAYFVSRPIEKMARGFIAVRR